MKVLNFLFFGPLVIVSAALLNTSCFNPPAEDVQFSCDLETAPECPPDYSCRADGCCHRNESDFLANFYACRLGTPPETSTIPPVPSTSGESSSTSGTSDSDDTSESTGAISETPFLNNTSL